MSPSRGSDEIKAIPKTEPGNKGRRERLIEVLKYVDKPLDKLRCIEANSDWDAFMTFAHDCLQTQVRQDGSRPRLQTKEPAALPELEKAA